MYWLSKRRFELGMVAESVANWARTAVNVSVGQNYLITKLYRNNVCLGVLMASSTFSCLSLSAINFLLQEWMLL